MKATLVFLLCALPLGALLAYLDRGDRRGADLPETRLPDDAPLLLSGADLADTYGQSPFSGAVRQLDGFELRVVEEGYFKLYLRIERLGRHQDKPRLEEVRAAIFDPPKEGKPNLRMTLKAPFVGGDPRDLLHAPKDAPRIVTLGGGVEAFDGAGRPLAEAPSLALDVNGKTVTAGAPVVLRLPDRAAEVRAEGLDADLGLRKARLKGPVLASVARAGGPVTIRAKGGATVEEAAEGAEIRVSFEGDAEIEEALGRAKCQRIDAVFARAEGQTTFLRASLSGGVHIDAAPGALRGIETVEMPSLAIEGEEAVAFAGPVRATWRGLFSAAKAERGFFLPLGERTVEIDAAMASFRLARAEDGALALREARFSRFSASDTEGGGSLAGNDLVYDAATGALAIEGDVDAKTAEGSLVARRLVVTPAGKDAYDLRIDGTERIAYRAGARLGALSGDGRGQIAIHSKGAVHVTAREGAISFRCDEHVVASTDGGAMLTSEALSLETDKGAIASLVATGSVRVSGVRGANIAGDRLTHSGGATTVEGSPASISMSDGREVRAPTIVHREDRTFRAKGGVEVTAPLDGDKPWRLRCSEASGALAEDGTPVRIEAKGDVRATGPLGEDVTGDSLAYDGAKGMATLLGSPARLRRGDEIALVAPEGLTLRIVEGQVAEGASLGPSTIDYRPKVEEGAKPEGFTRWIAELKGPATFEGERVVVPLGARLRGFDGKNEALVAEANRVEILLDVANRTAREIRGAKGVRVESRGKEPAVVTADRLSYEAGSREVRVAGDAQVVAKGWPREVRFKEVLFALAKDGIDLKRASEIEVRDRR